MAMATPGMTTGETLHTHQEAFQDTMFLNGFNHVL
jgi:hypothetical protein